MDNVIYCVDLIQIDHWVEIGCEDHILRRNTTLFSMARLARMKLYFVVHIALIMMNMHVHFINIHCLLYVG